MNSYGSTPSTRKLEELTSELERCRKYSTKENALTTDIDWIEVFSDSGKCFTERESIKIESKS